MNKENITVSIGKRILSEANDLKRTIKLLSKEININEKLIKKIIDGDCSIEESYEVLKKMGSFYPIDISDLYLLEDDCSNGVKIMRSEESEKTSRIYNRINKDNKKTPYYEYRDTAMSKLGPFKPEWIKQLRSVRDSDPYNPDVAYNNGHLLHQITFFVGPVNFYWEVNGKKYCKEMNTGDSNYITPFWPHSFTTRDSNQDAYILAITFGGDVSTAQKELYALGNKASNYSIEYRNHNKATRQLIKQHMINENLTIEHIVNLAKDQSMQIDFKKLMNQKGKISLKKLGMIAILLNIELDNLIIPIYKPEDEVVVQLSNDNKKYLFPDENNPSYNINRLARTSKMPNIKGFSIEVLSNKPEKNLITSLHTYLCNYGNSDIDIFWKDQGSSYKDKINKFDSVYLQPFVDHGFSCENGDGKLFLVRVLGKMNLSAQKEFSYMANVERAYNETKCWFD